MRPRPRASELFTRRLPRLRVDDPISVGVAGDRPRRVHVEVVVGPPGSYCYAGFQQSDFQGGADDSGVIANAYRIVAGDEETFTLAPGQQLFVIGQVAGVYASIHSWDVTSEDE